MEINEEAIRRYILRGIYNSRDLNSPKSCTVIIDDLVDDLERWESPKYIDRNIEILAGVTNTNKIQDEKIIFFKQAINYMKNHLFITTKTLYERLGNDYAFSRRVFP